MKKTFIVTTATLVFACSIALAAEGSKPSDREVAKIKSVLSEIGCEGGEYVKELSGLFDIDNAKCKIGEFDLKLDKDFDVARVSEAKSSEVHAHRPHAGRSKSRTWKRSLTLMSRRPALRCQVLMEA